MRMCSRFRLRMERVPVCYCATQKMRSIALVVVFASVLGASPQFVDTSARATQGRSNDPAALELFRDRGFGLFIHWGVDGSLGGVISHSLVGASPDYTKRFFETL